MPITINGSGTITGASTLATTVVSPTLTTPTLTTPNINSAPFATVTGTTPIYPCRAWVNFDGTGTPAIRGSGNVSSITDNGTGDYTVNFTIAMPDSNYGLVITATNYNQGQPNGPSIKYGTGSFNGATTPSLKSTTQVTFVNGIGNGTAFVDSPEFDVAIFR
jgi:hypothetical protein